MTNEKRKKAMNWWNELIFEVKFYKTIDWLTKQGKDADARHPNSLTGREIQEIYELNPKLED